MYKKGDYVLIRDTRVKPDENAKIKPKYKGYGDQITRQQ